jgi:hypothetical protein
MANLLDDLFHWAAQQPPENGTSVNLAMTGNETRNNLVSYAEGPLTYTPASNTRKGMFLTAASFNATAINQYFSDRRSLLDRSTTAIHPTSPFDPHQTDPLDITISALAGHQDDQPLFQYAITLHSPKYHLTYNLNPNFDPTTGIIYATLGDTFFTFSLCGRRSDPPSRIK